MVFVVSVHLKSFEHVSGTEFLIPKARRSNNLFMNVLLVIDFYLVFHLLILSVDNGFLTIFFHRLGLVTSNNLFLEWGLEELQCQISLFLCLSRVSRASAQVDDAELVLCNKPNSLWHWCNSRLVERIFFRYLFFFFLVDILFIIIILLVFDFLHISDKNNKQALVPKIWSWLYVLLHTIYFFWGVANAWLKMNLLLCADDS